ncbi:lamin tail domain-containing protein [Candidatus Roizmanbacteria bacterium]|nr:lamin tail domain-containing protein [Candidatus Roizmanbacteria bacterium]
MKIARRALLKLVILALMVGVYFIPITNSYLSDNESSSGNTLQATCWGAPDSPTRTNPSSDYSNNTNITFSWTSTTNHCPSPQTYYQFQFADDVGFTVNLQQSGWITSTSYPLAGLSEGTHYWRILAKDQYEYISTGSTYTLIVDATAPSASLEVTGSGYKAVEDKISNGDFELGNMNGWTTYGDAQVMSSDTGTTPSFTVTPYEGSYMARVGRASTYVWQNRLMKSFDSGAKSISLRYNFFSRDVAPNDDPGFFIRLNGQEIFSLASKSVNPLDVGDGAARSSGWQQFYYNLSNVTDTKVNLALYAGNTTDTTDNSWVYLDKITTYFISAKGTADYKITGTDGFSGISSCYYEVDGGGYNPIITGGTFQITGAGTHSLSYYCTDAAGNSSLINPVTVITDTSSPSDITDLTATATTANSVTLAWTAPGNDGGSGRAASYDVRYSTANITNDADFSAATKVDKISTPQTAGSTENLEVIGLNASTTYYFAIKTLDEAPNTSGLSNILSASTIAGSTVNAGDIVINELMWMGSSLSTADEWIELRNMTDHDIALDNFYMTRFGTPELTMFTIPVGKTITARGYFLISNFAANASRLINTTTVDYQTTGVNLSNTNLSIKLYDASSNIIDSAWNGTTPREGLFVTTAGLQKYYSMERTSIPGDGTNQLNWYSCIDAASTTDYFDGSADERGTPRAQNRSENEPYNRYYNVATTPTVTPVAVIATSEASLTLADDKKTVSFSVSNIADYNKLSYELSYDAFSSAKGLVGSDIDISSQDTFEKNALDLATCSGEVCTYDQDVKNFKLVVTLTDKNGKETKLEKGL